MEVPPAFQEAANCVACQSSFTTFRRRHHCRSCGRSFCNDHSANQKALPQYGLYTPVRVCDECFNPPKRSTSNTGVSEAIDRTDISFKRLDLETDNVPLINEEEGSTAPSVAATICLCGMPLCICKAPVPSEVPPVAQVSPTVAPPKPKRSSSLSGSSIIKPSAVTSSGNNMPSLFFSSGHTNYWTSHPLSKSYDLSGEGLREAVKNGDVTAVRELLSQGVDSNYFDQQGMSLLHLAAMFNFTEITFMLMDAGASVQAKNAQGETPLDCAQPTLGHKMQQRIELG